LFSGKMEAVRNDLKKTMQQYAKNKEFELAEKTKRTLFALDHIKDVSLIKQEKQEKYGQTAGVNHRIESYDISHFAGKKAIGVMVVFEDGEPVKDEYRLFNIK